MVKSKSTCPKWHFGQDGHGGKKNHGGGFLTKILNKKKSRFLVMLGLLVLKIGTIIAASSLGF
jgi:hypothetical protein